ncbi:MAG: cold shock and DUF1294 domain-containing protein [Actinomycetota bacterium]
MKGIVVSFREDKGFGFIRVDGRDDDVFLHVTDIPDKVVPAIGQRVRFDAGKDRSGRTKAVNVELGGRQMGPITRTVLIVLAIAAGIAVGLTLLLGVPWVLSWLVGINLVTLALYRWDKTQARRDDAFRIPERTLHLLALLGGTPAAALGRRWFRHKTRKTSFRVWFWLIAVLQVLALVAYLWWRFA